MGINYGDKSYKISDSKVIVDVGWIYLESTVDLPFPTKR